MAQVETILYGCDKICRRVFDPPLSSEEIIFRKDLITDILNIGNRAEMIIQIVLDYMKNMPKPSPEIFVKAEICESPIVKTEPTASFVEEIDEIEEIKTENFDENEEIMLVPNNWLNQENGNGTRKVYTNAPTVVPRNEETKEKVVIYFYSKISNNYEILSYKFMIEMMKNAFVISIFD
jgi:hypothetical protein